jgi:hypothetical protein
VARGPQRKSRTIGRSTQPITETTGIAEITEIADIAGIASSNPRIRRRRDRSITLPMEKSGARSIVPQHTIWKSGKLFWIIRRCHHHQHRWPKNPVKASIAEPIPITRIKWGKSM